MVEPLQLTLPPDKVVCAGEAVIIPAMVSGGVAPYAYHWSGTGQTFHTLSITPEESATYTLVVTDQCGAAITGSMNIQLDNFSVRMVADHQGDHEWYLQAHSVPVAEQYEWHLGDGSTAYGNTVIHSYGDLEEHWAQILATNANGCTAMDSVLLIPPAHIYFPNAFTPDGDGVNEAFGALGHAIDNFELLIFDRWGEMIYQTTDLQEWWDGTVNGTEAQTGVYVYRYRASGQWLLPVEGTGHVTLLR